KENFRVEKSARAQASDADCSPDQRVRRAVQELVGRWVAGKNYELEGRDLEDSRPARAVEKAGRNFAGSICGGEKRRAPAQGSRTDLHGVRSADGLGHGALRRAIAWRYRFAQGPNRGDGHRRR